MLIYKSLQIIWSIITFNKNFDIRCSDACAAREGRRRSNKNSQNDHYAMILIFEKKMRTFSEEKVERVLKGQRFADVLYCL